MAPVISFFSLLPVALGSAILGQRAVPESTPTGALCNGPNGSPVPSVAAPSASISASEVAAAVAGCSGVSPVGVVRNDIIDGICKPYTLIFARGTTETGNIGSIVGPPFVLALEEVLGGGEHR